MAGVKTKRKINPVFMGKVNDSQPQDNNDKDMCQQSKGTVRHTRSITATPLTAVTQLPRTCYRWRNSRARKLNAWQLFRRGLPAQGHVNHSMNDVMKSQSPLSIQYKV